MASGSQTITIDCTKINSTLTDFPVVIDLDVHCPALVSDLGIDKLKLKVEDSTPAECYVEIECWETGNHVIHIKVPSISSSANTEFTISWDTSYADNTTHVGVTGSTPGKAVWDGNFVAVYHMAQDPSAGADCIKDSTSNSNHGTPSGTMTFGDLVDGPIGKALDFDSDDYINLGKKADFEFTSYTLEAMGITSEGVDPSSFLGNYYGGESYIHYGLWLNTGTGYAYHYYDNGSSWESVTGTVDCYDDWNYVASVLIASTSAKIFTRGVLENTSTTAIPSSMVPSAATLIARNGTSSLNTNYFIGKIAEIRFSNSARSDAWIKATNYSLKGTLFINPIPHSCLNVQTVRQIFSPLLLGGV